jgi:hypothetical protein
VNADEVLDTKMYLRRIREWPDAEKVNPKKWLDEFAPEHLRHAVALLDAFVFISDKQVKKLFISTVHALSSEVALGVNTYSEKRALWQKFLNSVIVTAPTGETPSPTDSGHIFQRLARTDLGINESRIVLASDLRKVIKTSSSAPIILVDDFAGSGDQFLATWRRESWNDHPKSLEKLTAAYSLDVYYLPLIATEYAVGRIAAEAPNVSIRPGHILTDVYNAADPNTIVFPDDLRSGVEAFIRDASSNAGITNWVNGFYELGLDLAFGHSIPDACLALLWSEEGGWKPLMART